MKLTPIAKAINQLLHDTAPPPGAEPPTPWGGFPPVIDYAEVHPEKIQLLEETRRLIEDACGVRPVYRDELRKIDPEQRRKWLEGTWDLPGVTGPDL